MTPEKAKELMKELGLNGVQFSSLMGKNKNYVSDFKRFGVPENIALILVLSKELLDRKMPQQKIIGIIKETLHLYEIDS